MSVPLRSSQFRYLVGKHRLGNDYRGSDMLSYIKRLLFLLLLSLSVIGSSFIEIVWLVRLVQIKSK